jgi:hypothetical protein
MSTGQTLFVIFAFVVLSTLLLGFYQQNANVKTDMVRNRDLIAETSVAKSYIEMAQALEFDDVTMKSDTTLRSSACLTPVDRLGRDSLDITGIDDFDDLNNFEGEEVMNDSSAIYNISCRVYYVDPEQVDVRSSVPTFVKRMDIKVWRGDAGLAADSPVDTVELFTTSAYFRATLGMVRPPVPPAPPPTTSPGEDSTSTTTTAVTSPRPPIPRRGPPRSPRPMTRPIQRPVTEDS